MRRNVCMSTLPGLYDTLRQPSVQERAFWSQDPLHIGEIAREEMGVLQLSGEHEYPPLERVWARPTFEIHGIVGGFVGEGSRTVIPAVARAKVSLRLPADLKSGEVFTLLKQAVKNAAPADVTVTVHEIQCGEGMLISPDTPPIRAAAVALKEVYGKDPIFIRSGGSVPIAALFNEILRVPVVMVGFGLPDDNLHAPNEKYSLDQFFRGLRTVASFLQKMG